MAQSADSTRLCEICIGGPGEHYCQQCGQLFCGNCKLSHLRAKISKKHTFISGQNINNEEKLLCTEHEESFLFYCHDCDTPVCRLCSVEKHSRHLMTDLTKSAENLRFELLKIIKSKATTSASYMGKIKEDAITYREKTKAVIKTITEEGNNCKKLIDKKVHSFVKLVQDEEQKTLQSMSTDSKVYLGIFEKCQQWQNNIKEMETTADVILLKKLKHIKTDVDQIVLRQSPDTQSPSVSYTNKKLSDTDIDNLFGELECPYKKQPISLAEKFSSLFTDEYTDAMEIIEDDMDEAASVKVLLDWLKKLRFQLSQAKLTLDEFGSKGVSSRCYEWCQRLAKEQRDTLMNRSIGFMEDHGGQKMQLSDRCYIFVKEFQEKIATESLVVVGQICHVKSVTQRCLSDVNYITKYIKKCSELCWMMQISDPPLYLNFDVNSGEKLNKNDYNVFTKSGSKIDYLVWPVLYLHKTGPMLAKGVAQGK